MLPSILRQLIPTGAELEPYVALLLNFTDKKLSNISILSSPFNLFGNPFFSQLQVKAKPLFSSFFSVPYASG